MSSARKQARGSYTPYACALCRARKRKCDGVQPTCGFCEKRGDECVWGSELPKKPASKQLVDSLKNRIEALTKENEVLRLALSRCNCSGRQHLDLSNDTSAETYDDYFSQPSSRSNSPDDLEELCAPTKNLVLESDERWRMYGPTSAFRMNTMQGNTELRGSNISLRSKAPDGFENWIYKLYAEDDIDWSRHLPITALTRGEHDRMLELGFNFSLAWGPRLAPELFFRDMYCALSSPTSVVTEHYSPMLHNATVALLCSFSEDPGIRDIETRKTFLKHAKTFLDEECRHPNISTIQALDIMASCHANMADNLGYMYFGMSGRISQALGLNVDCSAWVASGSISHQTMVQRSWAYWDLYSTDVCWSLYVGRDCCLPDPSSATNKVPPPPIDDGIDLVAWDLSLLSTKVPAQPKRVASIFIASCELMKIGRKIVDVLNSGVRQKNAYKHVTEIDLELNAWKENLSPEIDTTSRGTALLHRRLVLQMLYWWMLSLLHRPFYFRPVRLNLELDHVKICDKAAQTVVSLLSKYDDLYGIRFAPSVVMQVTFSAGTVFLLSAVRALSGPRVAEKRLSDSLTQADVCLKCLGKMAKSYESSQVIKEILENMARVWVAPRISSRFKDIPLSTQPKSSSHSEAHILPAVQNPMPETLEPWEHDILKPLETDEPFIYQQPMEGTHACFSSGSSMPGGQTLPNQPFMTFNYPTNQERTQLYPDLNSSFSALGPESLVADMGMSAQELMDDLARFWR